MKPFLALLLITILLNVYGCQIQRAAEVRATAPLPPAPTAEVPPAPKADKPTSPSADVENALWHLRYARGLLEKKQ